MRCTTYTSSASPRKRNVQRDPSTIGTSWRARNRSTAAASSGLRSLSRLIASLAHAGPDAGLAVRSTTDARILGQAPSATSGTRTPSSSTRQRAGANRRASTDIRTGSSTRSRRRSVRQRHEAADDADPLAEHLGLGDPVRDEVVEEHHALGQGHGSRRPGDHDRRQVGLRRGTGAAPWSAHRRARRRGRPPATFARSCWTSSRCCGDHRPLLRAPGVVERVLGGPDPVQVLLVDQAHDVQRVGRACASRQRGRPSLACATSYAARSAWSSWMR